MADWGNKIEGGWYRGGDFHEYRDEEGTRVPSSTQVFSILGCSDFSMVDPADLAWKKQFGKALHRGTELLLCGRLDWDTVDDELIPGITGIEQWLKGVDFVMEFTEETRVATISGMKFGMTCDARGSLIYRGTRRPAVLDIKTGSKFSKTWDWQIGSYAGGSPKHPSGGYVGAALQVDREGRVIPHWVDTFQACREFGIMLAAANLKLNNGMAKIGGG